MQSQAFKEAMQGVRTPLGEVWAEAVASHVFHLVLIRKRRDGGGGIFFAEGTVKEDEVGEAAADGGVGFLEGFEVGLFRERGLDLEVGAKGW